MLHQASDSFGPRQQLTTSTPVAIEPGAVLSGFLVFVGYYFGARIGFALTFQPHPVSVFWPPNSILLAALLLTPVRIWWFLLLAAFPAHLIAELQFQVPPTMVVCWFISNCGEALIGAGLTRYFTPWSGAFRLLAKRCCFLRVRSVSWTFSIHIHRCRLCRNERVGRG